MTKNIQRAVIVLAATICALVAWSFMHFVSNIDLAVKTGLTVMHVTAPLVAVTAIIAGLAAWGLLELLERVTTHARGIWMAIVITLAAVSLLGTLGGVTGEVIGSLAALHAIVATVLVAGMAPRRKACRA